MAATTHPRRVRFRIDWIAKRSPTMAINVYKLIPAAFRWGFKKDLVDRDVSAKLDRRRRSGACPPRSARSTGNEPL